MNQDIFTGVCRFTDEIAVWNSNRIMVVCGSSYINQPIKRKLDEFFEASHIEISYFNGFSVNPKYEEVIDGIGRYNDSKCDGIIAIGGGSAIDVAKCIKLFAHEDTSLNLLGARVQPNGINLAAIPTTAGSGSESTRFATIYYNGEKNSVQDDSILPKVVLLDASTLDSLPEYQRKSTFLDAYCHSVESLWSVNATEESRRYAMESIEILDKYVDTYMDKDRQAAKKVMYASNLAGKAINISKTTAGHAMCYKLTTLYGIAHGYAAALCVLNIWKLMLELVTGDNLDCRVVDGVDPSNVRDTLTELIPIMERFEYIVDSFDLATPTLCNISELDMLRKSVNVERLKNHPVRLSEDDISNIYTLMLG